MNRVSNLFKSYLATFAFILMFIVISAINFLYSTFSFQTLFFLFITILPFLILGYILDFTLNHNMNLKFSVKRILKLLPAAILTLTLLSSAFSTSIPDGYPWLLQRLLWLFTALPFMIGSYEKELHKSRLIFSGIGTAAIILSYLYLSTLTDNLDKKYGALIYFIAIFLILYSASTIKRIPFISSVIGIVFAIIFFLLRIYPMDKTSHDYGWDINIANNFEFLLLGIFLLCIPICFIASLQNRNKEKISLHS